MRQRYVVQVLDDNQSDSPVIKKNSEPQALVELDAAPEETPALAFPSIENLRSPVSPTSPGEDFQSMESSPTKAKVDDLWGQERRRQIDNIWREENLEASKGESFSNLERNFLQSKNQSNSQQVEYQSNNLNQNTLSPAKSQRIEGFYRQRQGSTKNKNRQSTNLTKSDKKSHVVIGQWLRAKSWLLGLGLSVGFIFLAGLLGYLGIKSEINYTFSQVEYLIEDVEANRVTSARERWQILSKKQKLYKQAFIVVRPVFAIAQGPQRANHLDRLLTVSDQGLEIMSSGLDLYDLLDQGYQQFVGEQNGDSIKTFTKASGELEALFTQLSALQAELNQFENPYNLAVISELQTNLNQELPNLRRDVLSAQKISQILPSVLAEDSQKTYLVLLQNNAELRPTGGFIGSVALVTLKNGRLEDFKVEDVYEIDGQLNGFVTPPEEIVQYLEEEQWFLRDVNWSADFPEVAKRAGWFVDKALGVNPDGVIGINLLVIEDLLRVTGPIELVDYDEIITADNLLERAQLHSELNFFPGSNQKKDFLSSVANQLLNEIFYKPTNKTALARSLLKQAETAQLLVSFNNEADAQVFADLGWDGDVLTPPCPAVFGADDCIVDTIMQVEANVGVNKANTYVEREVEHQAAILADRVRHHRTITWTNNSPSNSWPAGDYKVFVRFYVNEGSELKSAQLDGENYDLDLIKAEQDADKQVFGTFLKIPFGQSKVFEITYETPLPVGKKPFAYALFEQKQSGLAQINLKQVIDANGFDVLSIAPEPSEILDNKVIFEADSSTHQFSAIEIE